MFPSIDNQSGLQAVKNALEARQQQFPPTDCILEALKLCLESNNSVFNKHFLQTDGASHLLLILDLENKLWEREKYWQCQLFTNTHGMNSVSDLYASKRKGCRKK